MGKVTTLHWGVYTRNQEAVAQAIARKENIDFIVPADNSMCITEDARSLAQMKNGVTTKKDQQITAVGIKNLTTYEAYKPPADQNQRGPKATLNAIVVTRWKGKDVPREKQVVLITSLPVDDPLQIV